MKSAIVLRDRNSRMIGVIDTFRLYETSHTMIARITGAKARFSFKDIIGKEPAFMEAVNLSRIAAQSNANVLIEGESGTGKEMFAHAIHQASMRSSGPLVIVNCASLPRSLIESELFGYESGSFTGAKKKVSPASLNKPMAVPYFWMKSLKCPWICSQNFCGFCRTTRLPESAAQKI